MPCVTAKSSSLEIKPEFAGLLKLGVALGIEIVMGDPQAFGQATPELEPWVNARKMLEKPRPEVS